MADRTLNGLHGCINSLDMTIGPCVDRAGDSLAREQVVLMTKYLSFVSKRANLIGDRVRFELRCYLEMGSRMVEAMSRFEQDASKLADLCGQGKALLALAEARQVELSATTAALQTEISRIVRRLPAERPAVRKAVETIVVACSHPLNEFQRSWFAPQAWETNADHLPDVEALLAISRSSRDL